MQQLPLANRTHRVSNGQEEMPRAAKQHLSMAACRKLLICLLNLKLYGKCSDLSGHSTKSRHISHEVIEFVVQGGLHRCDGSLLLLLLLNTSRQYCDTNPIRSVDKG
jgi:hypothetical protein